MDVRLQSISTKTPNIKAVKWAITGVESSPQVIKMVNRLTTIGYVSSMMSFMNSLMLTLTTTCFALVLYIKKKLRDKAKQQLGNYFEFKEERSKKDH